jgi:hypothetical protein
MMLSAVGSWCVSFINRIIGTFTLITLHRVVPDEIFIIRGASDISPVIHVNGNIMAPG